jgi:photosystem II biogenesis protein Psp29
VKNVRTVSDTKRAFYNTHTRPINSVYRRFVEELLVEMHLLVVNDDFRYDPLYALGVVSAFQQFMHNYHPDQDKAAIFDALCQAIETNPQQYQQDAQAITDLTRGKTAEEVVQWIADATAHESTDPLQAQLRTLATNPRFKYNRPFAIGIYTLLEMATPELAKDDTRLTNLLEQVSQALHLPDDKLRKDLELYRSNLEKMSQARQMVEDLLEAERKKRQKNAAPAASEETLTVDPPTPSEASQ